MKYFFIICILLINFAGLFSTQYNVSVDYLGLEVVNGLLLIDDAPAECVFRVELKVHTTSFYDFFYNVDNIYSSSYSYTNDGVLDFRSHSIQSLEGSNGVRKEEIVNSGDLLEIDSTDILIPLGKQVVNSFALFKFLPSQDYSSLLLYSDKNLWQVFPNQVKDENDSITIEYTFCHYSKLLDNYKYTDILSRKLVNSDSKITITYKNTIAEEIVFEALFSDLQASIQPAE